MIEWDWEGIGDVLIIVAAVVAAVFVLLYTALAPWWRSPTGRNIMAVMGVLAVGLAYFAWAVQVGGVPFGLYQARALFFAALGTVISWRIALVIKAQLLSRQKTPPKKENESVEDIR